MANTTITIPLDPQTARAYGSAAPEQKRKIQALLSLWLRELTASEPPSLQQVLDDAGRHAGDAGSPAERRVVALRIRYKRLSQCLPAARFKTSPRT
jgi:hypothetical protein